MSESINYEEIKNNYKPKVYVLQELPGTRAGSPKINIMSASKFGEFKFLLPEFSQIIFSPGPLIFKLRNLLKDYTKAERDDFLNMLNFYFQIELLGEGV